MHGWIYDKKTIDLAHDFRFMGASFEGKMNQSVKTREPNLWCSYRISNMAIFPSFYPLKIWLDDSQDGYISPPFIFSESVCLQCQKYIHLFK